MLSVLLNPQTMKVFSKLHNGNITFNNATAIVGVAMMALIYSS